MNAEYFLDTNIFLYTFDLDEPGKKRQANRLIRDALESGGGIISWQVVQEFLNVALQKWETPMTKEEAEFYVRKTLLPLWHIYPNADLYGVALRVHEDSGYQFYDCLIVAAAIHAGARTLFTEDMQDGRRFGDLTIRNPFA